MTQTKVSSLKLMTRTWIRLHENIEAALLVEDEVEGNENEVKIVEGVDNKKDAKLKFHDFCAKDANFG